MAQTRGLKLRCHVGHFEMATFELKPTTDGFWMWVTCDFGGDTPGHWLAPDPTHPERVRVISTPYAWPSAVAAFGARDRWEGQEDDPQPLL